MTTDDKFAEQVVAAKMFIKRLTGHLDGKRIIPRTNVYVDAVLLALLSKAIRVASAVITLTAEGFGDEAFGLSRSLIDIALSVRYITNKDSEARAQRYVEYFAKDHEYWTKIIAKYYPGVPIDSGQDHLQMLETARSFPNPNSWTGLGGQTKDMAREQDTVETDSAGIPLTWEFDYEVIYKWASHYVHTTAVATNGHQTEQRATFAVSEGVEPPRMGSMALFNAVIYLWKICFYSFRILGPDANEISTLVDTVLSALRPNMRSVSGVRTDES